MCIRWMRFCSQIFSWDSSSSYFEMFENFFNRDLSFLIRSSCIKVAIWEFKDEKRKRIWIEESRTMNDEMWITTRRWCNSLNMTFMSFKNCWELLWRRFWKNRTRSFSIEIKKRFIFWLKNITKIETRLKKKEMLWKTSSKINST
jgi:hypothetical protein